LQSSFCFTTTCPTRRSAHGSKPCICLGKRAVCTY
jgi:hypothetical protein